MSPAQVAIPQSLMEYTNTYILTHGCAITAIASRHAMSIKITRFDRSVFRDLGFDVGESEHLKIRADLMIQVQERIAADGSRQADVAKILSITQPRVSDLIRGRIDLFSTDTLIDMLARLGVSVRLELKLSRNTGKLAGKSSS
jgi:predicted XRE-type DNA-binding protein